MNEPVARYRPHTTLDNLLVQLIIGVDKMFERVKCEICDRLYLEFIVEDEPNICDNCLEKEK